MNAWSSLLPCFFFVAVFGSAFASEIGASGTALLTKMFNSQDSLESVFTSVQAELIAFEEMTKIMEASFDILSVPAYAQEEHILLDFCFAAKNFAAQGSNYGFTLTSDLYPLHNVIVLEYFATLYIYHQEIFLHINGSFLLESVKRATILFDACIAQRGLIKTSFYYK